MSKIKKAKQVTPKGVALFPSLHEEATFNDQGTGAYETSIRLNPSDPGVADFIERIQEEEDVKIEAYLQDLSAKDKKAYKIQSKWNRRSVCQPVLDDEGDETGEVKIKFKRKLDKGLPVVVDASKKKIKGMKVPGGSIIRVAYALGKPYAMGSGKFLGVAMYMNAVQLIELASFGGNEDDFDEEDGYESDGSEFEGTSGNDISDDDDF